MKKYYSYAGMNLCIQGPDEYMYKDEKTLASFRMDQSEQYETFHFSVVEKMEEPVGIMTFNEMGYMEYRSADKTIQYIGGGLDKWEAAYMRIEHIQDNHYVSLKKSIIHNIIPVHTVFRALQSERLLAKRDTVIMHVAYIERNGRAILFTAPSGTGKSTQADLWRIYRGAEIINGDRAAVRFRNHITYACGVPFAGSSNICKNETYPVEAIVCLKQGKSNEIRRLRGYEAFRYLYEGCGINTWDKEHVEFVSGFIQKLVERVPVYVLSCTPDEAAVITLEKELDKIELMNQNAERK